MTDTKSGKSMTPQQNRLSKLENTVGQMRAMLASHGYCFSDGMGTSAPELMGGESKNPVHTYEEAKKVAERVHKEMTMDAKDHANVLLLCNLARLKQERDELLGSLSRLLNALAIKGVMSGSEFAEIASARGDASELIAKVEK